MFCMLLQHDATDNTDLHCLEAFTAQNEGHVVRLRCATGNSGLHNAGQLYPTACHLLTDLVINVKPVDL